MFRAIAWMLKLAIFTVLVLVLSHSVKWDGKTVSDRMKTHMSSLQRSGVVENAKSWAEKVTDDARQGIGKSIGGATDKAQKGASPEERIAPTERQKLRTLIRELNGSS